MCLFQSCLALGMAGWPRKKATCVLVSGGRFDELDNRMDEEVSRMIDAHFFPCRNAHGFMRLRQTMDDMKGYIAC